LYCAEEGKRYGCDSTFCRFQTHAEDVKYLWFSISPVVGNFDFYTFLKSSFKIVTPSAADFEASRILGTAFAGKKLGVAS
jgi:hypothetical protein